MQRRCGTPGYAAPELLRGENYSANVDVFASGVVLYLMLCGSTPFAGSTVTSILRRTLKHGVSFEKSAYFENVSDAMKDLIRLLLEPEPASRPGAAEAARWLLRLPKFPVAVAEHRRLQPVRSASPRRQAPMRLPVERQHRRASSRTSRTASEDSGDVCSSCSPSRAASRGPVSVPSSASIKTVLASASEPPFPVCGPGPRRCQTPTRLPHAWQMQKPQLQAEMQKPYVSAERLQEGARRPGAFAWHFRKQATATHPEEEEEWLSLGVPLEWASTRPMEQDPKNQDVWHSKKKGRFMEVFATARRLAARSSHAIRIPKKRQLSACN